MTSKNGFTILIDRSLGDDRLACVLVNDMISLRYVFDGYWKTHLNSFGTHLESKNPNVARDIRSAVTSVGNKIATEAEVKKTMHAIKR
jgi:hypothetical protein